MIHLIIQKYPDGTSCPVSLEIEGFTFNYGECNLFEKLESYINYKILVSTIFNESIIQSEKIIREVFLNEHEIWTISLD